MSRGGLITGVVLALSATALAGQQPSSNPHGALPAGLACTACHTVDAWTPLRPAPAFDHATTAFPLTGSHAALPCGRCHLGLRFDEPRVEPGQCDACHADVHRGSLQATCDACHTTTSFAEVQVLELHARSGFPLVGEHLQLACERCHQDERGGAYARLDATCASCHLGSQASSEIDHQALGFDTECGRCHNPLSFAAAVRFDHATYGNGWVLEGAHGSLRCASCHETPGMQPRYAATAPADCIACHAADFQAQHGTLGYPENCLVCHTQMAWEGATFDHVAFGNGFPLDGKHADLECTACHFTPGMELRFTVTGPQDCMGCHTADYNREHAAQGYPRDCTSCHTVQGWSPSTFDHDGAFFPIYSGEHRGAWATCQDCHPAPDDFAVFTCLSCHEHNQQEMDDEHREVSNYVYASPQCLSCHPTGEGG